jgi:hypothetical protein
MRGRKEGEERGGRKEGEGKRGEERGGRKEGGGKRGEERGGRKEGGGKRGGNGEGRRGGEGGKGGRESEERERLVFFLGFYLSPLSLSRYVFSFLSFFSVFFSFSYPYSEASRELTNCW